MIDYAGHPVPQYPYGFEPPVREQDTDEGGEGG